MMAQFLQQLTKTFDKQDLSFVRISVNSLHEQSKKSLESIFDDQRILECISIEDIIDNEILKNQVLFVNWERLNRQENLFIKDNEQNRNLENVVRNTKDD
jgi:type III restriction enzyme